MQILKIAMRKREVQDLDSVSVYSFFMDRGLWAVGSHIMFSCSRNYENDGVVVVVGAG